MRISIFMIVHFISYLLLLQLFILSPIIGQSALPSKLFQLKGIWLEKRDDKKIYEKWQKDNNSSMLGVSYTISDQNDTSIIKLFNLTAEPDGIYITPVAKAGDNAPPVKYKLAKHDGNMFQFINNTQNFPKIITYNLKTKDSLIIVEEGIMENEPKKLPFIYKRISK